LMMCVSHSRRHCRTPSSTAIVRTYKTVGICAVCDAQSRPLIAVTDQGDGFDPAVLPDPRAAENICSSHGRGVFLMRRLVDDVEFNLGGRQVVLRKRLATRLKTEVSGTTVRTLDR
jgi:anti-sigma regulatory factor (Ser/Thr protein kinase)